MTRGEALRTLERADGWDVVVIGGGATGLGCALDAAARGYRTLLLEQHDFAKGTSSRSTKLIHGGVRYLEQFNISLVRESLRERGRILRNAPHLARRIPFVVPCYRAWEKFYFGAGLKFYDLLAGGERIGRSRILGRAEMLSRFPPLRRSGLRGGIEYFDGQFDDSRLAIALMRSIEDQGGTALNYLQVSALLKEGNRISGVDVVDRETGASFHVLARVVINAAGIFTDAIRQMDEPCLQPIITRSRGIHLVFDRSVFPSDQAIMIPKTEDGRVLFLIPWQNEVLLGTTDTPVEKAELEPKPDGAEIDYLLRHISHYLEKPVRRTDVKGVFAGLRPLVQGPRQKQSSAIPRDHYLSISGSGLVTITGGKWTTYRHMAEVALNAAAASAGLPKRPCGTAGLKLHGYTTQRGELEGVYGADASDVRSLIESGITDHPDLSEPLFAGEVVWAVRAEKALHVEDVLARRRRILFLDPARALSLAPDVAAIMARELGKDGSWVTREVSSFQELAKNYLP